MLTQLLIHVSKEEGSRGEYTKKRGLKWATFIDGGLSRALNGAGAWTGAAAGCEKRTAHGGPLTRAEQGIRVGGHQFRGPGGRVTNTRGNPHPTSTNGCCPCWQCPLSLKKHLLTQTSSMVLG